MLVIYIIGQHVLIFGLNPLSVCHIFQGNKFHIIVRCTFIYKFDKDTKESIIFLERNTKESNVYSISNYVISSNNGSYWITRHEYNLNF